MHGFRCVIFTLALLVGALAAPAYAQTSDTSSTDTEAHALFEAGRTAFTGGRFADALGYFRRAYELSHRSQLLYNVGQCEDRLRHDAEAIQAFEQFLAEVPDTASRAEVEARLVILRGAAAHEGPTPTATEPVTEPTTATATASPGPTPPPVAPAPTPASQQGPDLGPWILVGVGGAVAIAGVVLVALGMSDIATVENAAPDSTYASVRDADHRAPIFTGVGWAGIGVGVLAALGGVAWAVVGPRPSEQVSLRIGPGSLTLSGSF